MKLKYEFVFADNHKEEFNLNLKTPRLLLEPLPVDENDSWVKLGFHQCKNCPLDPAEHEYCPVARNLLYIVTRFKDHVSYHNVLTRVSTGIRQIEKNTSLQSGLSSLIGLIMATSGCPVLDKFRPMVFTHLPFSDENETIFRAVSVYLLAQYLRAAEGKKADWKLKKFENMYSRIEEINRAFFKRFRVIKGKDANVNALLILEVFAQVGELSLTDNWIKSFKPLFTAFLDE